MGKSTIKSGEAVMQRIMRQRLALKELDLNVGVVEQSMGERCALLQKQNRELAKGLAAERREKRELQVRLEQMPKDVVLIKEIQDDNRRLNYEMELMVRRDEEREQEHRLLSLVNGALVQEKKDELERVKQQSEFLQQQVRIRSEENEQLSDCCSRFVEFCTQQNEQIILLQCAVEERQDLNYRMRHEMLRDLFDLRSDLEELGNALATPASFHEEAPIMTTFSNPDEAASGTD